MGDGFCAYTSHHVWKRFAVSLTLDTFHIPLANVRGDEFSPKTGRKSQKKKRQCERVAATMNSTDSVRLCRLISLQILDATIHMQKTNHRDYDRFCNTAIDEFGCCFSNRSG